MTTQDTIKEIFEANCFHTQIGNVDGVLETIHTKSPSYAQSKQVLDNLFAAYKLNVEMVSFNLIAEDDDFAYVRAQQKVTKVSGPEFKDNVTEQLMAFKLEEGVWKIWTTAILSISPL